MESHKKVYTTILKYNYIKYYNINRRLSQGYIMSGEQTVRFLIYFILGGTVLTVVTYFGSKKEGLIAAFFAMFPVVTALTLFTIYSEAGTEMVLSYVRGLLILTPVWVLYLFLVMFLLPKHGFWVALISGIFIYVLVSFFIVYRP